MNKDRHKLNTLLSEMRSAFARGENAMARARQLLGSGINDEIATLLAYDLQAGSYNRLAEMDAIKVSLHCQQLVDTLSTIPNLYGSSILEVGCGECTTMKGVLSLLADYKLRPYGFDISWSRLHEGRRYLDRFGLKANLFVANLFEIPMADHSVDIVYSSHSLEPNGGREHAAIKECLRVARRAVALFEPIYELASPEAQARMKSHGYVSGLRAAALDLGATVKEYRLLDHAINPLNPTGLLLLEKHSPENSPDDMSVWISPITGAPLTMLTDVYADFGAGLVYPVVRDIPMLRPEHAIVASHIMD